MLASRKQAEHLVYMLLSILVYQACSRFLLRALFGCSWNQSSQVTFLPWNQLIHPVPLVPGHHAQVWFQARNGCSVAVPANARNVWTGQARNISRTQQATELQQTPLRSVTKTQQKQEQDISGTGQHISKTRDSKYAKYIVFAANYIVCD